MATDIKAALAKLDANNENHWTADGLPRIETVKFLAGDQSLTRELITNAAPGFSRAAALQGAAFATPPVTTPAQPSAAPVTPAAVGEQPQGTGDGATQGPSQEEQDADETDETDEMDALSVELRAAQDKLDEIRAAKTEIDKTFSEQLKLVDALILAVDKARRPSADTQNAIQAYLARQRRNLQDRADRQRQLKGVDLASILKGVAKSPLDLAMARKNMRGAQRPNRTPQGVKK